MHSSSNSSGVSAPTNVELESALVKVVEDLLDTRNVEARAHNSQRSASFHEYIFIESDSKRLMFKRTGPGT
jgi:hypothetical protein